MQPLKKSHARVSGQGCFLGFALVWTGFSAFAAFMLWREGDFNVIVLLFVLIGVLMFVAASWRAFSRLKLASPKLTITNTELRVGERFNLGYEQTYKLASEIAKASVELIFQEAATYTQGTDTRTDRHDRVIESFEIPGRRFEAGEVLRQSYVTAIPDDAMHTFVAQHNKLQWFIRVRVDIVGWPDMRDDYEIRVLPIKIRGF